MVWEGKVNNLSFVPGKGSGDGLLISGASPAWTAKGYPTALLCVGTPRLSQPRLRTSEDSVGFSSFFQPARGSGALLVFINGIAEVSIPAHGSSSPARKGRQAGWGRALPCTWVGGHGAGAPLALGGLLACSRLEEPAHHLGTQLPARFGLDGGGGRGEVPRLPPRH